MTAEKAERRWWQLEDPAERQLAREAVNADARRSENSLRLEDFPDLIRSPWPIDWEGPLPSPLPVTLGEVPAWLEPVMLEVINSRYSPENYPPDFAGRLLRNVYRLLEHLQESGYPCLDTVPYSVEIRLMVDDKPAGLADIERALKSVLDWLRARLRRQGSDGSRLTPNVLANNPGEKIDPAGGNVIRPPCKKAWQANAIRQSGTTDQSAIARKMTENGVLATQGQVSKWLKSVDEYFSQGNKAPSLEQIADMPDIVSTRVVEMGARQDGRSPHQRPQAENDD